MTTTPTTPTTSTTTSTTTTTTTTTSTSTSTLSMTATATGPGTTTTPATADPEARGVTTISDRAIARIAAHAAGEIHEVGGPGRGLLGRRRGGRGGGLRGVDADASVDGRLVRAHVELSVAYPAPVRQVTRQVRDRVKDRVEDLTGLTVRQVDIDVAVLEPAEGAGR